MKPIMALQFLQRRRCGISQNEFRSERFFQTSNESFGRQFGAPFMRRTYGNEHGMLEWREVAAFAEFQFLLEVTRKIVMPGKLNRWTEWCVGLNKDFTAD